MNKYFIAIQEKGGWSEDEPKPPVIAIFKVPSFEKFKDDPYIHVNSVIFEVDVYKTFHIVYEDIPTPDQDHGFRTLKLAKRQLIRFGFNSGLPRL